MNIDKIKNYNQKLLAVIGTLTVIIAIIGLISFAIIMISEINVSSGFSKNTQGILSDEKIAKLKKENLRQQLISFDTPRLIDTVNLIYVIPVAHKNLNNPEMIDEGLLGLMDTHGKLGVDSRYSRQNYGGFNNLLIYDFKKEKVDKLFDERVNFNDIQTAFFKDDILIMVIASAKDTYKDGVINQLDHRALFLYSLRLKTLKEISIDSADVFRAEFVENTKDLLIEFGLDHDKDGNYNKFKEPSIIKKYDYENGVLKSIVNEKMNRELQGKLEGTN